MTWPVKSLTCLQCGAIFDWEVRGRGRLPVICSDDCKRLRDAALLVERRKNYPPCTVEGCENTSRSAGTRGGLLLCEMHYGRVRVNGILDTVTTRRVANRTCHHCGGPAPKQRIFCSEVCRRRDRLGITEKVMYCCVCNEAIPEDRRLDAKFCGLSCQRISERGMRYGMTAQESFDLLFHPRMCELCRTQPAEHIDHNHETGALRGLLCGNCNAGLGLFGDSIERLAAAIEYLESRGSYGLGRLNEETDPPQGLAAPA
jgi:predicted nucleic acid-binding Zn ribbon protein